MSNRILILTSKFNQMITGHLEQGAMETLARSGYQHFDRLEVPGAFELPLAASEAAATQAWRAIVCLGCVIRGETPHFDYVCSQAASGIMRTSLAHRIPIAFGVLTTNTIEQAMARAGLKHGNKGCEAAQAVVDMLATLSRIKELASG
jgi:6,7-dimethyl-8-ribityllumazine synthase